MRMAKSATAEDFKLLTSFEEVRQTLLQRRFADRLAKPLVYWALPNDRRLPLAFLGRTLHELLHTPFDQLTATPGIGHKKITSLVNLLHRATHDIPPLIPCGHDAHAPHANSGVVSANGNGNGNGNGHSGHKFDPNVVSEVLWSQWRETVRKHDIASQKLGHVAPTLQNLPTVIWHTPLSQYLNHSLGEIRNLRTHGEKRVRAVLEIFHALHEALSGAGQPAHLSLRLTPKFVPKVENWIADVLENPGVPSAEEFRERLVAPLLAQLELDAGDSVTRLAASRLGLNGPSQSIRQQARRLGVTRARVYQLLDDCSKVFDVRWPAGKWQLDGLADKFAAENVHADKLLVFAAVRELFYPAKYAEMAEQAYVA